MKLFLIRHGQSVANVNNLCGGHMDVPLTDEGKRQAEAIRPILAKFQFDRVYTSDLSRARDTQRLAMPDVTGIVTPLIREIHVGSLAGLSFAEIRQRLGGVSPHQLPDQYLSFGGESKEMVAHRMRKFLSMLEEDPCDYVAAFSHGGASSVLLESVLGGSIDRTSIFTPNCSIQVFEFDGQKWKLLAWNYMGAI